MIVNGSIAAPDYNTVQQLSSRHLIQSAHPLRSQRPIRFTIQPVQYQLILAWITSELDISSST